MFSFIKILSLGWIILWILTLLPGTQVNARVKILYTQNEITIHYNSESSDNFSAYLEGIKKNGTRYYIHTDPGNPGLPFERIPVVLPPECELPTLKLVIRRLNLEPLGGEYAVPPSPPYTVLMRNFSERALWGNNKIIDERGKNKLVYECNSLYPEQPVRILNYGTMGPFRIARLCVFPFLYNPQTRQLHKIKECEFILKFNLHKQKKINVSKKYITSILKVLSSQVANPETLNTYQKYFSFTPDEENYDFVIITTGSLVTSSERLDDFVALKQAQGFRVKLVTDADFSSSNGPPPNGTEEKVRAWLQQNYLSMGIKYALIISDPRPTSNQIPMKLCWARLGASDYPTIDRCYTDYYYADLTGNWDIDGDQRFGEYYDDCGTTGVDFFPEVFVGRIPYYGAIEDVDSILQKLIDYENQTAFPNWRRRFLLPTAIAFYENQVEPGLPGLDGASFARRLCNDLLVPWEITPYRLFEKSGIAPSPYPCEAPLNTTNVLTEWQKGYGFACLFGHGSTYAIYRTIWTHDNSDNIPQPSELSLNAFFTGSDASSLDDSHPAITFLIACNAGNPGFETQIGYNLLRQGAVAVVSASAPVFVELGEWQPYTNIADAMSIAYFYFTRIIQRGEKLGEAFYLAKSSLGWEYEQDDWHNLMAFNLFSDPSLFSGLLPEKSLAKPLWTFY